MIQGHALIINYTSWAPFTFIYNPENIESHKKINYATIPNIGGSYKKRYFSGFDSKEVSFNIMCVDMESPSGVFDEVAFFETLREPDPGPFNVANVGSDNANFPPPQVLFQFGVSYLPLVWDVLDIGIKIHHFHDGNVRGVIGIPKVAEISIRLSLDEEHVFNQANQIAKKALLYSASIRSTSRELLHKTKGVRKELPGFFSKSGVHSDRSW